MNELEQLKAQNAVLREALGKVRRTLALILDQAYPMLTRELVYSGEDICDIALSLTPPNAAEIMRRKDELLSSCAAAVVAMADEGWLLEGSEGPTEAQYKAIAAFYTIEAARAAGVEVDHD